MRKFDFVLLLGVLLILPFTFGVVYSPSSDLILNGYESNPLFIEPGKEFTLSANIYNSGSSDAGKTIVYLDTFDSFFIKPESDQNKLYESIGSLSSKSLRFYMIADSKLISGDYSLKLYICDSTKTNCIIEDVILHIKGKPQLNIIDVSPEGVVPGIIASTNLTVVNTGAGIARNVLISITTAGLTDVKPTGSATSYIEKLIPGESKKFTFTFSAVSDPDYNVYIIPLVISYNDEQGTAQVQNKSIGLLITGKVGLVANIQDSSVFMKNTKGDVSLSVVNKGEVGAKFLEIEPVSTEDYTVIKGVKTYIGDLKSDEYEKLDFSIITNEKEGDVHLVLSVDYQDTLGVKYEKNLTTDLHIYTDEEVQQQGLGTGEGLNIVQILIILLFGVFVYKKRDVILPFFGKLIKKTSK